MLLARLQASRANREVAIRTLPPVRRLPAAAAIIVTLTASLAATSCSAGHDAGTCAVVVQWGGRTYESFGFAARRQGLASREVVRPTRGEHVGTGQQQPCNEGGDSSPTTPVALYAIPSVDPTEAVTDDDRLLLVVQGGSVPVGLIRTPRTPRASATTNAGSAPPCRASNLRVSDAFWVSPPTQTDLDGMLIRNVGSRPCTVEGPVHAWLRQPGRPPLRAVVGGANIGRPPAYRVLAPRRAAAVLVAASHGCAQIPRHRYHRVTLRLAGAAVSVRLPDRSRSPDRDFAGLRLALAVSRSCLPAVSGPRPPIGSPRDLRWHSV